VAHLKEETSRLVEAMKLIRQGLFGEAGGLEREPAIVWRPEVKPDFISWMKQNDKSKKYIKYMCELLRPLRDRANKNA